MPQLLYQVDAFTDQPFSGNPAAVCVLEAPRPDAWMQSVAMEMNLSETAFVLPQGADFGLRWFTPTQEIALCGHATLAAAHVLWEQGILPPTAEARFHTLSGLLRVARQGAWMEMDFPLWASQEEPAPAGLAQALGAPVLWFGRHQGFGMALLENAQRVKDLRPDLNQLRSLPLEGVVITAAGDEMGCDFVSRVFAPNLGIDEDPVTGSTHCMLTPYWAERLGKTELLARQLSRRGGVLRVAPQGERVLLRGQAVTVMRAELV
ncbi:MAG: PhzF family phenazine biosynthesis protein [Deltaproteobacteria bacterium]|nr:PhzF family phenazine biosynthesis protein [Deltaproteobacteria bacterium]